MTPFDPDALLAMLLAFYPTPSAAALAQARRERPEYFAAGVLGGSKGDKLTLPDGRVFDCIQSAGGPIGSQRWICIDVTHDPGGAADPFALDAGPLAPLDPTLTIAPFGDPGFEAFVGGELAPLDGADGQLDAAHEGALAFQGAAAVDGEAARLLDPAQAAHVEIRAAIEADDPTDVIDATNSHDGTIDAARDDYVEPEPPDTPEPDPGDPPGGHAGDNPPPPPDI